MHQINNSETMKTNFTFYLKSSLMVLFLGLGLSSWGQTETLTITRSDFPSGALVYGTDDLWTATTSGGDVVTGYFDLFSNVGQTTMQTRTSTPIGSYPYNVVAIPGNITKITLTGGGTGSARAWTPYLSTTPLTKSNYTSGENQGTQTAANNSASTVWEIDANEGFVYFYLNMTGGAAYLNSIVIEFETAPATPTITTDLTSLNMGTTVGTTVTSDIVVTGTLLTSDINVGIAGDGFSVNPTTLTNTGGTVTVTYNPTTVGNHTGTVTFSNADADNVVVSLNGTATLATPIAIAATDVASNSFTANWNAVAGATGYEIDVYSMEDGGSVPVNVVGWDFEDENTGSDYGITDNLNRTITTNSGSIVYNTAGGNTSLAAISSSGWDGGSGSKHWTVSFTTAGISNMKLSSIQRSSNTGPKDFKVQYSLDASNWTDVPGANITVANNFTTGVLSEVALPVECDNQSLVYLRWIMTSNIAANNNEVASGGTSAIDDIIINGDQGGLSIVYHLENENVGNVTSYSVTGLNPETTYYYVVRAVAGTETSANSNEIEVTTTVASTAVTWTGTAWINGTPSIDEDVVIEGDLFVGTDVASFEAKTLTVVSGGAVYIESGNSVTVAGAIDNQAGAANFIVESGANLVQNDNVANTGAITVYRDSQPMKRLDYTLWSSPVEGMSLKDFSQVSPSGGTGTIWNRVFTLGATSWEQVWATQSDFQNDTTTTFTEAQGYLYRSRNDYSATETVVFEGEFVGIPHNGTTTITTSNAYDAVGNPYASSVDADLFLSANTGVDALYFWTNTHAPVDGDYDQAPNNWASYTTAGGTAAGSSATPNGQIATGQGFVVENADASVTFDNAMRTSDTGMFFKTMESEKHRLWLNLSIEDTMLNQMMVAYMDEATEGVDAQIDGKMFGYAGSALYSIITGEEDAYAIQGRSLPFTNTDVVALGFRAVQAGTYTVSLADFDGLFADGQDIYLKDNTTQTYNDLKAGAYTFVATEGIFESRFEVVYQADGGLNTNNPVLDNKWIVYAQDNGFQIEAQGFELKEVLVYDMLGRLVYNNQAAGTSHTISNIATGVLIVKVITTDNQVLTRKTAK